MVKESTLLNIIETLKLIKQSGLSINGYFKTIGKDPSYFYSKIRQLKSEPQDSDSYITLLNILEDINNRETIINNILDNPEQLQLFAEEDIQDTDERVESSILRNNDGKIVGYKFKVYRRDDTPVQGVLNRDEMQLIYRLYSYYGASITQREISRHFPDYSLCDFKRILRAFNITKASGPFAPHMYEEKSTDELKEIHLREKENDFLKKIEKDELKDVQNTAIKLARKNKELEQTITELSKDITINVQSPIQLEPVHTTESNKSMIIYLADMHIGAKCDSDTLYPNPYDYEEIQRRLNEVIKCINAFGHLDTLIICLMGDSLDGMDQQTARRDHIMPQCMDNMEQLEAFLELMLNFIHNSRQLANVVQVISVSCGNHGGSWEYTANVALQQTVKRQYPDIEFILFSEFIDYFKFKGHIFCLSHGS